MAGEFFCGVTSVPHSSKASSKGCQDGLQSSPAEVSSPFPKGLCALSFFVVDSIFLVYKLLREAGGNQLSEHPSEFRVPLIKHIWKLCLNH